MSCGWDAARIAGGENTSRFPLKPEGEEMGEYILSHDIGTSSDKAVLVDFHGKIVGMKTASYPTLYPQPAWVEQVPQDYWDAVCETSRGILEENGIKKEEIKGIVFSTQAQGVIPVDRTGNALYNNITWVDGRAQEQADHIMKKVGGKKIFTALAGTPIMGKDCVAKITWIREERPEIYEKTRFFLTVNGYLTFKCTGRMVTELSGASAYGLDLKKKEWLSVFPLIGIDLKRLPPLVKSTDVVGGLTKRAAEETGLPAGTPVFGGCDDVQAAAVGSGMCRDGDIHIYLGTSAWVCAVTRTKDKFRHGAAAIQSADPDMNIIAGITESAGANIQWLADQFFSREKDEYGDKVYDYMDKVVESIPPGSDHLISTPWMLGERCPISSTTTRATLFNMTMIHTREHMMRAVYEGIGYNLRWILENYEKDYGFDCNNFRVIGGGALDVSWMQIIADITGKSFSVCRDPRNAGAIGGAIVALIGLGILGSFEEAYSFVETDRHYEPNPKNRRVYDKLFLDYKNVYYGLQKAYEAANGARFEGEEESGMDLKKNREGKRKKKKIPSSGKPFTTFETIKKYAEKLTKLDYSTGPHPCILMREGKRCLATRAGADFARLKREDIVDVTNILMPEKDALLSSGSRNAMVITRPPFAAKFADAGIPVRAPLDDMAQIIGPEVKVISGGNARKISRALRGTNAVLVRGEGLITCGRTLYEAFTALTVFEKAAEIKAKASVIGGTKEIDPFVARAMHLFYMKKYSRAEEEHKDESEG